jgi:hypothetical protein
MTRTDVLTDWNRCEELAAHMIAIGIDRHRVDAWLATVAEFLELRLQLIESTEHVR